MSANSLAYDTLLGVSASVGNVCIGSGCITSSQITGTNNVVIGNGAGTSMTSGTGNTIIGNGADIYPGCSYCMALGSSAQVRATGLTNAIALGHGATVGVSNTLAVGSLSKPLTGMLSASPYGFLTNIRTYEGGSATRIDIAATNLVGGAISVKNWEGGGTGIKLYLPAGSSMAAAMGDLVRGTDGCSYIWSFINSYDDYEYATWGVAFLLSESDTTKSRLYGVTSGVTAVVPQGSRMLIRYARDGAIDYIV